MRWADASPRPLSASSATPRSRSRAGRVSVNPPPLLAPAVPLRSPIRRRCLPMSPTKSACGRAMATWWLRRPIVFVDASALFLDRLAGVTDPERKRKVIGAMFIEVFDTQAAKLGRVDFLAQGTLYPDVIESIAIVGQSSMIKSHHNVGGLPERMRMKLVEPLRELFKDEVREVGRKLDLEEEFVVRQPFPGPGLAVRILGEITPPRLDLLRRADDIVSQEVKRERWYTRLWQSFAVLLPIQSVGVMGDERTYEYPVAIRPVE